MSPQEIDALRKEVKKLMIDLDLDKRGSYEVICTSLSERLSRPISIRILSMAMTGFREGKAYQDILTALRDLLSAWPSKAA